jgi:hypothetical protein
VILTRTVFLHDESRKSPLFGIPGGNRDYEKSVGTVWTMSLDALEGNSIARSILRLFAYLNASGIYLDLLADGIDGFDDELASVVADPIALPSILPELEKYSRIKWDRRRRLVIIHSLVQRTIRARMSEPHRQACLEASLKMCFHAMPSGPSLSILGPLRKSVNRLHPQTYIQQVSSVVESEF